MRRLAAPLAALALLPGCFSTAPSARPSAPLFYRLSFVDGEVVEAEGVQAEGTDVVWAPRGTSGAAPLPRRPRVDVAALEACRMPEGRGRVAGGALAGALVGGVAGLLAGAALGRDEDVMEATWGASVLVLPAALGVGGALGGTLAGGLGGAAAPVNLRCAPTPLPG